MCLEEVRVKSGWTVGLQCLKHDICVLCGRGEGDLESGNDGPGDNGQESDVIGGDLHGCCSALLQTRNQAVVGGGG